MSKIFFSWFRFPRPPGNYWALKIILIFSVSLSLWSLIHHSQDVPPDLYPYLTTIQPKLVLSCIEEGKGITPDSWADLLAVKSSLPETQANHLIIQIRNHKRFVDLDWGNLKRDIRKTITQRRNYLLSYPYYLPNQYQFPVQGKTWYEDSFGADREGGKRQHEGTDLFGQEGTRIVSVSSGSIEKLGWNRLGGERVGIRGDDGNYYYYAHLKEINPVLVLGQRIGKGEFVGTMGHTGDALTTPDHLHFGIQLPNEEWVNPYPFLAVWQNFSKM